MPAQFPGSPNDIPGNVWQEIVFSGNQHGLVIQKLPVGPLKLVFKAVGTPIVFWVSDGGLPSINATITNFKREVGDFVIYPEDGEFSLDITSPDTLFIQATPDFTPAQDGTRVTPFADGQKAIIKIITKAS